MKDDLEMNSSEGVSWEKPSDIQNTLQYIKIHTDG